MLRLRRGNGRTNSGSVDAADIYAQSAALREHATLSATFDEHATHASPELLSEPRTHLCSDSTTNTWSDASPEQPADPRANPVHTGAHGDANAVPDVCSDVRRLYH